MKSITTDRTIDNNKQPDNDTAFDEIKNSRKFGKDKKVRVIPGFHLTLGITVTMLSLIVLIPLASVMVYSLKLAFLMTFGRLGFFYPVIRWFNEFTGSNIRIAFAIPGVVLATIFVTFPYVSREIIPVLNSLGKDEEEAAALMGANGFTIFFKITLPNIKWSLIYGIILCTSRALGEFGAVNALSKTRGETFTLPLEIDALYMSGTDTSITSAFAVSSILVIIAIIVLVLRNIFEHRQSDYKKGGQK